MREINRRNYLTLMGSAGAALAIAACGKRSDVAQNTSSTPTPGSPEPPCAPSVAAGAISSRSFEDWPKQPKAPSKCESVTLIFDGLMGFFWDKDRKECQIGFHRADGMHKPGNQLWEKPVGECYANGCVERPNDLPSLHNVKGISLEIVGRPPAVDFYKNGDYLDRLKGDPMDFRWLIDLDEHYRDSNGKAYGRRKQFQPVLRVKNGTFYTRMITEKIFQRIDSNYRLSRQVGTIIGHLPLTMAAAIALQPNERVLLEYTYKNGYKERKELEPPTGKILELDFFSRCDKDHCQPLPCDDGDEKKRNDFHFMRKVLDLPWGLPHYSFALAKAVDKPAPDLPTCDDEESADARKEYCGAPPTVRLTQEAPCAGAGYGGGGCGC